jgi:hypothetical protein
MSPLSRNRTLGEVLTGEIPASEAYRGLTPYRQAGHEREPG